MVVSFMFLLDRTMVQQKVTHKYSILICFVVILGLRMIWTRQTPNWMRLPSEHLQQFIIGQSSLDMEENVCKKGIPLIEKAWLRKEFTSFAQVYKEKLGDNKGGTRMSHQFALWSVIKVLRPKHIIESGIWHGLGTWLLRKAAPEAQLILLDPTSRNLAYTDRHKDTRYFTGPRFKDFSKMQWDKLSLNKNDTLIFFDDHQSGVKRTIQAWRAGFRHIMFDDNYQLLGDNFSLKLACELKVGKHKQEEVRYKDDFGRFSRTLDELDVVDTNFVFDKVIKTYQELPMVLSNEKGSSNVVFANYSDTDMMKKFGLNNPEKQYVNICYVNLNHGPLFS